MKVKIHALFQHLLDAADSSPEAVVGFSLSQSPRLADFLDDLDPNLVLDWNNRDFHGLPELRDHVLAHTPLSDACSLEDVLITAGAAEANYLAIMQVLQPGDEIVVEMPGWPQAEVLARARAAKIRKVWREEATNWALPLDNLHAAVSDKTRMIFLSNPNNPTGQVLDAEVLREIVRIADTVGAWLLVDEVYAGLEWNGPRSPSVAGMYERGITTGSVSKVLGLQGLRTGWLICRDQNLIRDVVILRENSSEIMNIMGEVISEIALRPARFDTALNKARIHGLENLERMDAWVARQYRLDWVRPSAGLIGLARLHGISSDDLARRLLADPYRTFILPGSVYEHPDHLRLGVGGGTEANIEVGLQRLERCLNDWPD